MATRLASDALLTVVEYWEFRGGKGGDVNEDVDTQIELHINAASTAIVKHCNRGFVNPGADQTEIFDGSNTERYWTVNVPVLASPVPVLSYWNGSTWTVCTYTFAYDNDIGRIRVTDGNAFFGGYQNWKLVYRYGYTQATVPNAVKLATFMLVQRMLKLIEKQGLESENFGDQSTTYNLNKLIDANIQTMLAPYIRLAVG